MSYHIHEYHVDIPWVSVPSLGFRHDSTIAKKEVYDVLFLFYVICHAMLWYASWRRRRDVEALPVANDLQVDGAVRARDASFALDTTPAANRVDGRQIDGGDMVNVILQALEIRLGRGGSRDDDDDDDDDGGGDGDDDEQRRTTTNNDGGGAAAAAEVPPSASHRRARL